MENTSTIKVIMLVRNEYDVMNFGKTYDATKPEK